MSGIGLPDIQEYFAGDGLSTRHPGIGASHKDLLTKNIGLCFRFSSSLNNVILTEISETAK